MEKFNAYMEQADDELKAALETFVQCNELKDIIDTNCVDFTAHIKHLKNIPKIGEGDSSELIYVKALNTTMSNAMLKFILAYYKAYEELKDNMKQFEQIKQAMEKENAE